MEGLPCQMTPKHRMASGRPQFLRATAAATTKFPGTGDTDLPPVQELRLPGGYQRRLQRKAVRVGRVVFGGDHSKIENSAPEGKPLGRFTSSAFERRGSFSAADPGSQQPAIQQMSHPIPLGQIVRIVRIWFPARSEAARRSPIRSLKFRRPSWDCWSNPDRFQTGISSIARHP